MVLFKMIQNLIKDEKLMKKLLIPLLLLLPLHAYAVDKFYIEGQMTRFNPSKVDTETFNGTVDGTAYTGDFELGYDKDTAGGLELGVKFNSNHRIAASYIKPKFKLKSLKISATFGGEAASTTLNRSQVGDIVAEDTFDNDVKLLMLNYYYDFNFNESFVPFLGVGAGYADFSNGESKEFARSLYGGAKYYFNEIIYVGAKLSYTTINGPKDKDGIEYDNVDMTAGSVLLGFEF